MLETGVVRNNECYSLRQVRRHNRDIFPIFFNMKACCVFSLESPHRGDSNEYTQYTISNIKKKITLNYPKSAVTGFVPRDSRTSSKQPSGFEPLQFYCTFFYTKKYLKWYDIQCCANNLTLHYNPQTPKSLVRDTP